jgi:hypothetical protein
VVLVDLLIVSAAESQKAWGEHRRHTGARDVETATTHDIVTACSAGLGPGRAADSCEGTTSNARVTLAMRDRCRQPREAAAQILLVPLNGNGISPCHSHTVKERDRVMRGSSRSVVVHLLVVRLLRFTAADAADAAAQASDLSAACKERPKKACPHSVTRAPIMMHGLRLS